MTTPALQLPKFTNNTSTTKRPDSQVWLNVGYEDEDGKFQTPFNGSPIDTAKPPRFGGEHCMATFEAIQELGAELAEGDFVELNLKVRVYKRKAATEADTNEVSSLKQSLIA